VFFFFFLHNVCIYYKNLQQVDSMQSEHSSCF